MDNIFELLPFIIGILYFVFGVGKKKKNAPKPRSPRPNSPPKPATTLEDILRELSGEKARPEPVAPPVKESYTPFDPSEDFVEPTVDVTPEVAYVDQYEHVADTGRSLKDLKMEILEEQNLTQEEEIEFDLRQAIINDAVLNRPYS